MKELRITRETGNLILHYLQTRPWAEVHEILDAYLKEVNENFAPPSERDKDDEHHTE